MSSVSSVVNPSHSPGIRVRPVARWRLWLPGVIFWAILAVLAWTPRHSGNVWSRYMTIESLVERGTLAVERSPLRPISGSPDLVKHANHLYSDKPPVLSLIGSLIYLPVYLFGLRMSESPVQFTWVNWVLVTTCCASGSALAVMGIRRFLQAAPMPSWAASLLALGVGLGSLLLAYGVTFNNHSVAAGLITWAFGVVAFEESCKNVRMGRFAAGFLCGLAAAIDLPAGGATLVALGIWLAIRARGVPWAFLAGTVGPILAHAVSQTLSTGSPLPAEMTPELFDYKGSYWQTEKGRFAETGARFWFGLELLLGPQGWLTVTPIVLFGVVALARIAARRGDPLRPSALAVGGVTLTLLAYYVWGVRRTDFAGLSFGTRHLLAITPLVLAFGLIGLARLRSRVAWSAFAALLAISLVYSFAGQRDPWSRVERRDDSGLAVVKRLTLYPWSSYRR